MSQPNDREMQIISRTLVLRHEAQQRLDKAMKMVIKKKHIEAKAEHRRLRTIQERGEGGHTSAKRKLFADDDDDQAPMAPMLLLTINNNATETEPKNRRLNCK